MAITYQADGVQMPSIKKRETTAWIRRVAASYGKKTGDIAYVFCSSEYHLNINRTYLHHDYHTDVITFDYSDLTGSRVVSGDIFIDPFTVRDNADIVGTQPREEIMRVIVHGVLHLCGHGDKTPDEERQMRALEDRALALYRETYGDYPPFVL